MNELCGKMIKKNPFFKDSQARSIIIILLLFIFLPTTMTGLYAESIKKKPKKRKFFKELIEDQKEILTSPFRISKENLIFWAGTGILTGIMLGNDEDIYEDIKTYQEKNPWVDKISPHITRLGSGEFQLGVAGAFYLGGLIFKDEKARETARLTLMTFLHTGIVVQLAKHLTGRQRPSWDNGTDHFHFLSGFFRRYQKGQISRYDAFPSGHTISVFGTATVIARMYKRSIWIPVLSYSLATLCGLSRVTEDTHWFSDVFLGAVLGYAIGKFIVSRRSFYNNNLKLYPLASPKTIGIGLNYSF
jgi:membrane-associated phospholipid phosphatase